METSSTQTVFGFGCGLDWRPTSFVEAIASAHVCSACKLVPRVLAALPCHHRLCPQCYVHDGKQLNRCPRDKRAFDQKDVVLSTFSAESILSRKVRCWNAENGCDAEDAASAMLEHFCNDCRFHAVSCRTCGSTLLHREVTSHLESCCSPEESPAETFEESPEESPEETFEESPEEFVEDRSEEYSPAESQAAYLSSIFEEVRRRSADGNVTVLTWHSSSAERPSADTPEEKVAVETGQPSSGEHPASDIIEENLTVQARYVPSSEVPTSEKESDMTRLSMSVSSTVEGALPSANGNCGLETLASPGEMDSVSVDNAPSLSAVSTQEPSMTTDAKLRELTGTSTKEQDNFSGTAVPQPLQGTEEASAATSRAVDEADDSVGNIDETKPQLVLCPGVNLEVLMDIEECCEFTIENWSSFAAGKTRPGNRNGRCDCGTRLFAYGYVIVPKVVVSYKVGFVCFNVYAFKGPDGTVSDYPLDITFRLRIVHPTDCTKDLRLCKDVIWQVPSLDTIMGEKVHCMWGSQEFVTVLDIREGGFVANDKVRMRFKLTPW
ncbi:serine-rich adhesin for platelets-like [Dermacentor albipictus]|uniref:serine-rich adhesin for platelets-like n=1 Tax=Dermacentor albipictus TaxID=60249 RepID=UPI0038FC9ADA